MDKAIPRFSRYELAFNVGLSLASSVIYTILERAVGFIPGSLVVALLVSSALLLIHVYHRSRYLDVLSRVSQRAPFGSGTTYPELRERQERLDDATANILQPLAGKPHPIVRILEGWYGQVARELEQGGPDSFEINSGYYEACLARLKEIEGRIKAVADLSVGIEGFWYSDPDPANTSVEERIFLIGQEAFFDPDSLHRLSQTLQRHAREYSVLVSHARLGGLGPQSEFASHVGQNLLLIPPDVVGGYVEKQDEILLKIVRSDNSYARLGREYESLREQSVEFKPDMDYQELQKQWIQKNQIGVWRKRWSQCAVADRSAEYFDNYDAHIRCWIPDYHQFVDVSANLVKLEIVDLLREKKGSIKVLEIGFGTGAMTRTIIDWIDEWNVPLSIGRSEPVIEYFGLDEAAHRMRPFLARHVRLNGANRHFERGSAWSDVPSVIERARPFDIICGSLVLHDLVSGDHPEKGFMEVLRDCGRYLSDRGRIVFADVFTSPDPLVRQEQRAKWKEWMIEHGLAPGQAEDFISENTEMINTINSAGLERCSRDLGFKFELRHVGRAWSPFQILLMRRLSISPVLDRISI